MVVVRLVVLRFTKRRHLADAEQDVRRGRAARAHELVQHGRRHAEAAQEVRECQGESDYVITRQSII